MSVPLLTIVCIAVSLLVAFGTPLVLFLVWRKRFALRLVPALVGAAAFYLFAMVLERLLHTAILAPGGPLQPQAQPALYVLYACLAAGLFEETGRLVSFLLLKRRYSGLGTALSYGIGHGGIEAILTAGLAMLNNIIISIMLNTGAGATIPPQLAAQFYTISPATFLISGAERLMAIAVHIALSVLVYHAATGKKQLWLYPLAILLHAFFNLPAGLAQTGVLQNMYVVEGLVLVVAVAIIGIARLAHRRVAGAAKPA